MATLDELVVRIKADASQLERELKKVAATTKQAGNEMSSSMKYAKDAFMALAPALGAVAVANGLKNFAVNAVNAAGHIVDLADRIGFASTSLLALEPILVAGGSNLDEFSASINRMNNMIGEASKGLNQEAVKAFDQLGLSVRKLAAMTPEEQFYAVTEAVMKMGSQAKITEAGMNIFGKTFAVMQPALKEHEGRLRDATAAQKDMDEGMKESLNRVDAFGDALAKAGLKIRNSFISAFADVLKLTDYIAEHTPTGGEMSQSGLANRGMANYSRPLNREEAYAWKSRAKGFATEATFLAQGFGELADTSGKGSNAGLLKAAKPEGDPVRDYLQRLRDQNRELNTPEPLRTAQKAEDDLRLIAMKEGKKLTVDQIALARELAVANRELTNPDPIQDYISKLKEEQEIYKADEKQQAGLKAYYDLVNQTKKDGIVIGEEQKQQIMDIANANEVLKKSQEDARQEAQRLREQLTDGLTDVILHFDNATDAAKGFFDQIASQILKKSVTGPLAEGISSVVGGSGLFNFLGLSGARAGGGSVSGGSSYLVGERGPEIFTPGVSGGITPNHQIGGGVSVTNVFNVSPGVQGTVEAEVRRMAPLIAAQAQAGVFQAIERGGKASQLVGRRS